MSGAVITWADRENGIRFENVFCPGCTRRVYARRDDGIVRCDGCGEVTTACMCPPADVDRVPA